MIVLLCAMSLVTACGAGTSGPADQATTFWEALASGDKEAAVAEVDPSEMTTGAANTFGRAATLDGQFDWYEAVGWEWELEECVEIDDETAECTATARNAWSDALGVEPVAGTFEMEIGDEGITAINDVEGSFRIQWSWQVFEVFATWVQTNHPEDAEVMFAFSEDVNSEILNLYRANSERFVEAQRG